MERREFIVGIGGTAIAWPIAARAQQAAKPPRIGLLHPALEEGALKSSGWLALEQSLRDEGFVGGKNCSFEHRFSPEIARMPALAAELVAIPVDVIVVRGPSPMQAARAATTKIPIVMAAASVDPVGEGLIASYARPGGNITGVTYSVSSERFEKQLEILREAAGPISRVAVLVDTSIEVYRRGWASALERAAAHFNLALAGPFVVQDVDELESTFALMARDKADAVLASTAGIIATNQARVAELGIRHRLPVMGAFKELPRAGALVSYGPDIAAINRRVGNFVARILRGANPAELPVENPDTYDLVINLKTAKALGLSIPPGLLIRANEVIE
jgi:putative tryptophan/tyrosine transport system substrate-binding protein